VRTLSLKPQARLDLLQIWNGLAEESMDAAARFNIQVDADLEKLRQFPGLGHRRPELTSKPIRFWTVFSWFVLYRVSDDEVTVLRVLHGNRNLKAILKNLN
jgi:plasmid stabilization system protein ParE